MNDKKKYIAIITSFGLIHSGMFHHHRILFKKLSNNFEKIFVINSQNLRFFPKLAKNINMEKNDNEFVEPENIPKNFFFFNPKNSNEFSKFLEDKELIIINNFTKHFFLNLCFSKELLRRDLYGFDRDPSGLSLA